MLINIARETAGFTWQPEIFPIEYAIATITKPKDKAIPTYPAPKPLVMALPQPKKTKKAVPINSAKNFFIKTSILSFIYEESISFTQ